MRSSWFIFTVIIMFLSVIDVSMFKLFIKPTIHRGKMKTFVKDLHWIIYALFVLLFMAYTIFIPRIKGPEMYFWMSRLIAAFTLIYVPKVVVLIFSILGAIRYLITKLITGRRKRKYFIINKLGAYVAMVIFITMFYGFSMGRYDYRVKTVEIYSDKIPQSFDGFKIVHISDFHLGSFGENYPGVKKAVDMVNAQKPDIIAFTGDMVNNFSDEMLPWLEQINRFSAKYAKYSVLGNHDYGHYVKWDDPKQDSLNILNLKQYQRSCGFDILSNEHRTLKIGKDSITIAGVKNWGLPPFPALGKLDEALENTDKETFTLLLSHDSNHWDAEVRDTHTDLMLAGHTHAMQMGIEIGNFVWSPAKYLYKRWDGLYEENNKYLYVNRGLGYIAFPGRILQRPEITVIVLRKK